MLSFEKLVLKFFGKVFSTLVKLQENGTDDTIWQMLINELQIENKQRDPLG